MIIQNYGHLWERKYIYWGTGGKGGQGHLKGYKKQNEQTDFREQMGIYVLYDKDMNPIYVGQASDSLFIRLKQHSKGPLWNRWEHFSWFGLRKVNKDRNLYARDTVEKSFRADGDKVLNEIEGILITALEPRFNKQGAAWKKQDVEEYYQVIDENLEDIKIEHVIPWFEDIEKAIKSMEKKLNTSAARSTTKRKK